MTPSLYSRKTSYYIANTVVTKKQAQSATKKATLLQKFRLLFVRSHYSFDAGALIRYKQMDDITFIMKRGTKL